MGKGDKKTAKGKRAMGSYGNTRKRKSPVAPAPASTKKVAKEEAKEKKPAAKKAAVPKATAEKKTAAKKPAAAKKTTKKTEE